ncbi:MULTISPECIES: pilin [Nocardiopsis]|uniref:pilin n=1 Tax=Nocardiopsis TaxID=2013 RepID=UPI001D052FBA|nr:MULTISPECIES: pilin [Nocardiopsis]
MTTEPLNRAEREFRLLDLEVGDLAAQLTTPSTDAPPTTLVELRGALLDRATDRRTRDAIWRGLVTCAQDHEEWMVAAIGLAMPALRTCARRLCVSLDARTVEEVEEEILAGFVHAVREADTSWHRLHWALRCRAQRSGLRARTTALRQPLLMAEPPVTTIAPPGAPDMVLSEAARLDIITPDEAEIIGRTRLEGVSLATLFIVVSGVRWMVAGGESGEIEKAKRGIYGACIGYLIALVGEVLLMALDYAVKYEQGLRCSRPNRRRRTRRTTPRSSTAESWRSPATSPRGSTVWSWTWSIRSSGGWVPRRSAPPSLRRVWSASGRACQRRSTPSTCC